MNEKVIRIKYCKEFPANYIGHLDTISILTRAMRMAAWPLVFTRGHHPRIKLSTSPPLSLGYRSSFEYLDVFVRKIPGDYMKKRFESSLVKGIEIIEMIEINSSDPLINDILESMVYRIEFEQTVPELESKKYEVIEKGNKYIILSIKKESGGFKNPKKLFNEYECTIRKIDVVLNKEENNNERIHIC